MAAARDGVYALRAELEDGPVLATTEVPDMQTACPKSTGNKQSTAQGTSEGENMETVGAKNAGGFYIA